MGHTRGEPAPSTAQNSHEKSESIELKEQRGAPDLDVCSASLSKLDVKIGFAAAGSDQEVERLELDLAFDPRLAGGCAKKSASGSWLDPHVGSERVRPQNCVRRHEAAPGSQENDV
jgi:hypothetical protein